MPLKTELTFLRVCVIIYMSMKSGEMSYIDAREIITYLNQLIDQIEKERTDV